MRALFGTVSDRCRQIDADYDRFIRDGHLDALTLFAFFPALIVGDMWPKPGARSNDEFWLITSGLVVLVYCSYAAVGIGLGRKSVRPVLAGKCTWQVTSLVVVAAYLINMLLYVLTHTAVRLRNDIAFSPLLVLTFGYLVALVPVTEELVFQGYLQTRLRRLGVLPAMLITTVLFVCIHISTLTHPPGIGDIEHLFKVYFPPLFVFAIVRQYTGSLLAALAVHVFDNATIFFTAARG